MNTITKLIILTSLVTSSLYGGENNPTKQKIEAMIREKDSPEYNLMGEKFLRPIDDGLLKLLAAHPEQSSDHDYILTTWLTRIAAEADRKYLWLLDKKELQKDDLSNYLLAYDYNVNGNQKALKTLLDRARKVMVEVGGTWGGGSYLCALSAVNEWDLCRQELASHSQSADGVGDSERYAFWLKRRYFFPDNKKFPDNYETFCFDLEQLQAKAEQAGADQPATAPELKSEGKDKPQHESKVRPR